MPFDAEQELNDRGEFGDLDDLLVSLIEQEGGTPHSDLVAEILMTALKLVRDEAGRGDLKIINTTLKEMRYSFKVFQPYRRCRKVTVFGSARTKPGESEYELAKEFSRRICECGFMVITGAGPGIMQAAQEGAGREHSFGVNIRLPFEQDANEFILGDSKLVNFKYFFTRKLIFVKESDAIVLFPGGFGTHDEGFESLTLVQTGKTDPTPLVYINGNGSDYWESWDRYVKDQLLGRGLIAEEDLSLYTITDSVEAACQEIMHFYHVYNSCRYVRGKLVLRLNHELTDRSVVALNDEFSDIVVSGRIAKSLALPAERNEPHTAHMPRLVLHFNRHHYGRLRQLIDRINGSDLVHQSEEATRSETDRLSTRLDG